VVQRCQADELRSGWKNNASYGSAFVRQAIEDGVCRLKEVMLLKANSLNELSKILLGSAQPNFFEKRKRQKSLAE